MFQQGFAASDINKSFGALQVLNGVSILIKPAETVGLLGPNGAGKTTLINIIAGYEKQDSGTISMDGTSMDAMKPDARARAGIARTFQSGRLFSQLTVAENIALGALGLGVSRDVAQKRAAETIEILGLQSLGSFPAGTLSHGNARLVGLARAVASQPKYLIMDEPAAGLNEAEIPKLLAALNLIKENIGCGMFLVEHNVGLVAKACERVIVLATGILIFDGAPKDALINTEVKNAYLGDAAFGEAI
jgi:branched-chain amino acid transport system ATP-binding protein